MITWIQLSLLTLKSTTWANSHHQALVKNALVVAKYSKRFLLNAYFIVSLTQSLRVAIVFCTCPI
jgi:hypothetical protein